MLYPQQNHSLFPSVRNKLTTTIAMAVTITGLSSAAVAEQRVLEEVTVTAQKRAQNLQEVPIAISAFNEDSINNLGVNNVDELGMFAAGVETNNNSVTQAGYTIRGINSDSFTSGTDPSTAVYVDGVYTSRGGGALVNFSDVERVEVLRGPQGTLFGRNAAAGAISIITKKPSEETEGKIKATLGSADKRKLEGTLNTALTDTLFFRGSVAINHRDGIWDNAGDGADFEQEDDQTYRVNLLWNASDKTEVLWRAEYNEVDQDGPNSMTTNPSLNPAGDYYADSNLDTKTFEQRELFGTSLEVNHELEDMTFTSITSYRTFNTINREDEDGSDSEYFFAFTDNIEEQEQFSQEFRFTSTGDGPLKWTAGLNYFKEDLDQEHVIGFNTLTLESFALQTIADNPALDAALAAFGTGIDNSNVVDFINGNDPVANAVWTGFVDAALGGGTLYSGYKSGDGLGVFIAANPGVFGATAATTIGGLLGVDTPLGAILGVSGDNAWTESTRNKGSFESWAVYGDATYSLTEKLDVTVGARYTYDQKDYDIYSQYQNTLAGTPAGLAFSIPVDAQEDDNWSAFSPRMVVSYKVSEDMMTFASVARGFKSGGFNSFAVDTNNDGVGELSSFDDETVTNIELGVKSTWLENTLMLNATVFQYKCEDQQNLSLTDEFTATTVLPVYAVRNSDTEGSGFELEATWLIDENWAVGGNYSYLDTEYTDYQTFEGEDSVADNKEGESLPSAPKNKWNLFVQHSLPIADAGTLTTNINYHYVDERLPKDPVESVSIPVIDSYEVVNARVSFIDDSEDWKVALWANNLLDEEWLLGIGGTGDAIGSAPVDRANPRTYGVDFIYNF